jgi:hypothetical protein
MRAEGMRALLDTAMLQGTQKSERLLESLEDLLGLQFREAQLLTIPS